MSILPTTEQLQNEINCLFGALTRCAAERDRYREALERIACFHDQFGNAGLTVENTYSGFDEPVSVKIARQALEKDTSQ